MALARRYDEIGLESVSLSCVASGPRPAIRVQIGFRDVRQPRAKLQLRLAPLLLVCKIKLVWLARLGHSLLTGGTPPSPFLFFLAPLPRETAITVAYAGSVGVRKHHSEEEGFKGSEERSPSLRIAQRVLTGYNCATGFRACCTTLEPRPGGSQVQAQVQVHVQEYPALVSAGAVLCCAVLCCAVLCCAVLCCAVLC
jgi:hypothetical protein